MPFIPRFYILSFGVICWAPATHFNTPTTAIPRPFTYVTFTGLSCSGIEFTSELAEVRKDRIHSATERAHCKAAEIKEILKATALENQNQKEILEALEIVELEGKIYTSLCELLLN